MCKSFYKLLFSLCFFLFFTSINAKATDLLKHSVEQNVDQNLVQNLDQNLMQNLKESKDLKKPKFFVYTQGSYFWDIDPSYANKITKLGFGGKGKYKKLQFQQEIFYSVYERIVYFKSQELFLDYKPWFIGQKKHLWSWADELWGNNLWQSQFYQNPVQALSMGLLGLHWQKKSNKWSYYFFVSPIFLPRYSSYANIETNTILSFTPWLHSLPLYFEDLPIKYKTEIPSVLKLLNRSSIAFQLEYKFLSSLFLKSMFSYKPSNSIFLTIKPSLNSEDLTINIKPYTRKESLVSLEAGVKKPFWSLLLSSSYRSYKNRKLEDNYFADKLSDSFLYNLYYSVKNNKGYTIFTSYQNVLGYKRQSFSQYIELQETLFSYSYNYLEAIIVGVDVNNIFNIAGTSYKVYTTYDFKQKASLVVSQLLWKPNAQLQLLLNVTSFYKKNTRTSNSNFFLHRLSENSFVQMGVKYVF